MTHPVLPTQEQFAEWDSEYFDGERQNFDVMMSKAFQAGADWQLEQCINELNGVLSLFQLSGKINEAERLSLLNVFKNTMRPQEEDNQ